MQNENTEGLDTLTQAVAAAVEACRGAMERGLPGDNMLGLSLGRIAAKLPEARGGQPGTKEEVRREHAWDSLSGLAINALKADGFGPSAARAIVDGARATFKRTLEQGNVAAWAAEWQDIDAGLRAEHKGHPVPWLAGLELPDPGLTIFAARSGGGKTSALYNVARCLLREKKPVLFITREPTVTEVALNLAMSLQGDLLLTGSRTCNGYLVPGLKITNAETPKTWRDRLRENNGFAGTYPEARRALHEEGKGNPVPALLSEALEQVREWIQAGLLVIMDGPEHEGHLAQAAEAYPEHIVLLDYIQALRCEDPKKEGYIKYQAIMSVIRELCKRRCLVAGAQFNRKAQDDSDLSDMQAENLREAADLEQAAHLILGLGGKKNAKCWKVLKHRYDGSKRDKILLSKSAFPVMPYLYESAEDPAWQWGDIEQNNARKPLTTVEAAKKIIELVQTGLAGRPLWEGPAENPFGDGETVPEGKEKQEKRQQTGRGGAQEWRGGRTRKKKPGVGGGE